MIFVYFLASWLHMELRRGKMQDLILWPVLWPYEMLKNDYFSNI